MSYLTDLISAHRPLPVKPLIEVTPKPKGWVPPEGTATYVEAVNIPKEKKRFVPPAVVCFKASRVLTETWRNFSDEEIAAAEAHVKKCRNKNSLPCQRFKALYQAFAQANAINVDFEVRS